jgi:hypothetical protein
VIDLKYRAWLRHQPCIICGRVPCDVAHVGDRGLGVKCPDSEAVSLCVGHHRRIGQGGWKDAHHVLGRNFWTHHGLDRDAVIADCRRRYALALGARP